MRVELYSHSSLVLPDFDGAGTMDVDGTLARRVRLRLTLQSVVFVE